MSVKLGDKQPSYPTVKNRVARFRIGYLSYEEKECSGRPTKVTIPENMHTIHSMILANCRISTKRIAETLAISRERVAYIIHEILEMRKLSAKWVLKCLYADRKCDRVFASQNILD
jgi:predicted HTH transcriptional regulator